MHHGCGRRGGVLDSTLMLMATCIVITKSTMAALVLAPVPMPLLALAGIARVAVVAFTVVAVVPGGGSAAPCHVV